MTWGTVRSSDARATRFCRSCLRRPPVTSWGQPASGEPGAEGADSCVIGRAKGTLMSRSGASDDEAFVMLKTASQDDEHRWARTHHPEPAIRGASDDSAPV